ncbi:MAG: nuclear transport factor 2 family protein, partial [Bacteroidales bacterium]|nr:nuclear transport factor 2 family protein [Bacteroidales bacterium]
MRNIFILLLSICILESCNTKEKSVDWDDEINILNTFMDNWHHAAAIADEDVFFGSLDSNAVYLGTDPKERWLKHEFMEWGMKYFERDTA